MVAATQPATIEALRVRAAFETLLAPDARQWERATEAVIALQPTPVEQQPSAYVRAAWRNRPRGDVRELRLRALATAGSLFLRLQWSAPRPSRAINDSNVYADACAALFPANGADAEIATMGSPQRPVVAWHWRAGADAAFSVTATGLGTVERETGHQLQARGRWAEGTWRVVLGHPLDSARVPLAHDAPVPLSFAVWSGVARERAGLKSHSPVWHQLRIG